MGSILRPDGNKIRALRIQKGWPQEQLAWIADVSPRTIQRVEAGGNASFETLRSVAGAFELEVHELMQQATQNVQPANIRESCQLQVQPAKTDALSFSSCLPYVPILKMTLGSLALVLLAAVAIRLSPFFLSYLDPESPMAESYKAISPDSPSVPPVLKVEQSETTRVKASVFQPGPRLQQRQNIPSRDTAQFVATKAPASPQMRSDAAGTESRLAMGPCASLEKKNDGQTSNGTTVTDRPASLLDLEPIARGPMMELSLDVTTAPDTRMAALQTGVGLAELVSRRVAGDSISVSRSFVRSGKSTAAFFTKVGSSIKRAF